jgi:hypothetical protein
MTTLDKFEDAAKSGDDVSGVVWQPTGLIYCARIRFISNILSAPSFPLEPHCIPSKGKSRKEKAGGLFEAPGTNRTLVVGKTYILELCKVFNGAAARVVMDHRNRHTVEAIGTIDDLRMGNLNTKFRTPDFVTENYEEDQFHPRRKQ